MKPFRFIHTADLHLDSPFKGLSEVSPALQTIMQEATFRAVQGIVDLCLKREVQFLLIAGDVYDAADRSLRGLAKLRGEFERLAEHHIPVFMCHGNHDPLSGWGAKFSWPDNVHVFGGGGVEGKPVLCKGWEIAKVYGVSYDTDHVSTNWAKAYHKEKDSPWAIGLLHTNVGNDPNHMNYAPCELQDLVTGTMDYWALGHVHTHKVLHQGNPVVVYPGNPQGRHRKECGPRGCYVVDVGETGHADYQFVPVDVVRWQEEMVTIEGVRDFEDLLVRLDDRAHDIRRDSAGRGTIVRWHLQGRGGLHRELTKPGKMEDLLATMRDKWGVGSGWVWTEFLVDETARELDLEAMRQEENLLGDFLRLAEDIPETGIQEIREIMAPLFEDPRVHRYATSPSDEAIRQWVKLAEKSGVDRLLAGEE
jgi:DNA repair exonuclease SbcCD nuclease subunit